MLWGFSPALDIQNEIKNIVTHNAEELNILLIGTADGRHILKTISKCYTHPTKQINFYVCEVLLDFVARQLLLFLIALEPSDRLGLFEKTRLWMELYGNSLLRPTTRDYLEKKSIQLVHMVTDLNYLSFRLPLVNLDLLKYKERDCLESIFQFWEGKQKFNCVQLWDNRLRQSLGIRYDSRDGAFDWDYHMKLKDISGGKLINAREYRNWRNTGIAFTWLETTPSEDNLTFGSGIVKLGDRILHHGYLGDIVSSPFVNFGTMCEDEEMLKVQNGVNTQRSTDLTERNLMRMFFEIENQDKYVHKGKIDRELGVVITELSSVDLRSSGDRPKPKLVDYKKKEDYSALSPNKTKIVFLPTTALNDFVVKPKFKNFFDVVLIGQNLAQRLTPEVMSMAKNGAVLLAETRKYLTNLSLKEKEDFAGYLISLANDCNCDVLKVFSGTENDFGAFQVNRK